MEEKSSTYMSNGQQQFNLRWNNHVNNIIQVVSEQYTYGSLVDVTLACEGQYIKAHKMILSACSPYFQDLFQVHNVPHPVVLISNIKYTDLKQVLDFMYRGEVKVLETELDSLLRVAESLQVKGLSTVRNNNEKNQDDVTPIDEPEPELNENPEREIKKRKLSHDEEEMIKPDEISDDESLSSTIKIEPPEIKDIDQDEEKSCSQEELMPEPPKPQPKPKTKSNREKRPKLTQPNQRQSDPSDSTTSATKSCKIPRPPNAFMIFANEWRRKLATKNPEDSNKEISVRLGVMWKNLTSDEKEYYYCQSRKADEEHKRKYPGYYYSPKEARIRKTMKETNHTQTTKQKKNCDAMRFVKLVMTENNEGKWKETDTLDDEPYVETSNEDMSINTSEEQDWDTKEDNNYKVDSKFTNETRQPAATSQV